MVGNVLKLIIEEANYHRSGEPTTLVQSSLLQCSAGYVRTGKISVDGFR